MEYPNASGAAAISIVERDDVCSITTGKITGNVAARWWITAARCERGPSVRWR